MRRAHLCFGIACLVLALAGPAAADTVVIEYLGPHPIDPQLAKGMCFIDGPHVHAYRPHKEVLYVNVGGQHAFVGDPTEFEPAAPKFAYYGHHPVFWLDAPDHYCFITGPHYHWQAPPAALQFQLKGGAYWFVGAHPGWYKARAHKRLDTHYAHVHLVHPVIAVAPPVGFIGVVVGAPSVHVGVGFPGFGVVMEPGYYEGRGKYKHHGPRGNAWGYRGHGGGHGRGKWK
ncbi:MAG TPA: hypothetical protein VGQ83_21600 [Polyangia bacterium]|jgi:hypothetical protein